RRPRAGRARKRSGAIFNLAYVSQPRTEVIHPAEGSPLDRNEEQNPCLHGSSVERDKEGDGLAHQVGKRPRKETLFGGAPQMLENGAEALFVTTLMVARLGVDRTG